MTFARFGRSRWTRQATNRADRILTPRTTLSRRLEIMLFLLGITERLSMETTSVTSKGQVTIPKPLRQQLGLRQGSKVEFVVVGDHAEMRVVSTPADLPSSGFGMLRSKRAPVPVDFDPAALLTKTAARRLK